MNKKKLFFIALFSLFLISCERQDLTSVTKVQELKCWNTVRIVTHYETSNSGAVGGAIIGGLGGYLLSSEKNSTLGTIGGAVVGGIAGNSPFSESWTDTLVTRHCVYKVYCKNNHIFNTEVRYSVGDKVDTLNYYIIY